MKFSRYHFDNNLEKGIEAMGLKRPTDIQFRTIPHVLNGDNILGIAPTGTGKTAAFAIPVIQMILKSPSKGNGPDCLVLVPTRELAKQIESVFQQLTKFCKIKALALHGGVEQDKQIESLKRFPEIVITTPGRMFDMVHQGFLHLQPVRYLILDEAERMLGEGFIKDIQDLLKRMQGKRQTLLFSATINPVIKKLAYAVVKNPVHIRISPGSPVSKNIEHLLAYVDQDDKRFFLERIHIENPDAKLLVFVRTKVRADRVKAAMNRCGIEPEVIHSGIDQIIRQQNIDKFSSGAIRMLIATDVSARGIDIPGIDFVINYDLPDKAEVYVHRVGRTGRGNKKGVAVSFCSPEEKDLIPLIEDYIQLPIEVLQMESGLYDETIAFSRDHGNSDWRKLLAQEEKLQKKNKKK